jgi:hypothetical protein
MKKRLMALFEGRFVDSDLGKKYCYRVVRQLMKSESDGLYRLLEQDTPAIDFVMLLIGPISIHDDMMTLSKNASSLLTSMVRVEGSPSNSLPQKPRNL